MQARVTRETGRSCVSISCRPARVLVAKTISHLRMPQPTSSGA
ncbi:hypothetical protein BN1723_020511 [Verticillium longisporum]|uniref:Uncharacterized protein n=1 Tax=Verticillium longisporum TaxID=100787 RepID=A0A0G4NP89_VERLO|nr:hypothetical protein BN1723_020511 [Verticillium longisporum]